jgi:hypothetical protein
MRTALIQVRLSERERERWRAAAEADELKLAEFVRLAVRDALRRTVVAPAPEQRQEGTG